ncbi:MAG: 50S ribosomal protein L17 [Acidobacteria bacterium]|nr:50S ribosomal protein L17 [Acidobacteriota bacterium]NIM60790.1 50S ribosomal protein L17 [Acidobacteriota bacterium]NIQ83475.1 50S ribosomal protein L17 [Acidobacteriota bacterium]NIT09716.1 50S ribosomal protein L17 [Acidobacteriota bacterium]
MAGRKLGRTTEHRVALLRNLSTQLFANEKIQTTLAKAKELRPFAERLVTISKRGTLHARRQVARHIHDRKVVSKLFDTLSARYDQRPGGYTRIIKLGPRRGDSAEMAMIELVDSEGSEAVEPAEAAPPKKKKKAKATKKTSKKTTKKPAEKATKKTAKKKTAKKKTAKKKTTKKKTTKD